MIQNQKVSMGIHLILIAGHSYETQKKRLLKGKEILQRELLWTPVFMAPNHSFDLITIDALQELKFDTVLDGFAIFLLKK